MIKKSVFLKEIIKNKLLYLMFLPLGIYFIMFAYIPMGGIILAFKKFNYTDGILFSPWNGVDNFRYFFASGKALSVTLNTVAYNLVFLFFYTCFSILIAILISEITNKVFKKITQSFMFLPYFISWVVASAFIYNLFNYEFGAVNSVLKSFGFEAIDLYSKAENFYILLPIVYIWKWVGFGSVLYLAAIMGIDQECYEAATIDGANAYQKIRHITLPLLRPTMTILVLMGLGRIMRGEFDMFYQIIGNNGNLMDKTDIIDTLVFRCLMGTQDFGMATSVGFYQSVLCLIIILAANKLAKKADPEGALF